MALKKFTFKHLDKDSLEFFGSCTVCTYSLITAADDNQTDEEYLKCAKKIADKKYSLKIKASDLAIIDAIAQSNNLSRAAFLNEVIAYGLASELKDVSDHAKFLLGNIADNIINSMSSSVAWKDFIFGKRAYLDSMGFYNQKDFVTGEDYKIFKKKLESSPMFTKNIIKGFEK